MVSRAIPIPAVLSHLKGVPPYEKPIPFGSQGQVLDLIMTAYNSLPEQTCGSWCTSPEDSFITATGQRIRFGIIAASRDLIQGDLPYGTQVRVLSVDTSYAGCNGWELGIVLDVQDTMHQRKTNQLDLWLESYEDALRWGRCPVTVEVKTVPY